MTDLMPAGEPLAIVCGGGSFPGAVADAAARRGRQPIMFGIRNWADPKVIERYKHHWIALGQIGRILRLLRSENCRDVLLIGTLLRPAISQIRLDWRTLRLMPAFVRYLRGGDDHLLAGLAGIWEDHGLRVVGLDEIAPEVFVPEGALGRRQPTARDNADIARALQVLAALGPFDVGQAAVVANNNVIAVEAAEGTDHMLARVADLRREGRFSLPPRVGVLVKAPKPGQDRRFDLPSIGPRTIELASRAGLAGVAVIAGSTIIAEPAEVAAAAERENLFVMGVPGATTP